MPIPTYDTFMRPILVRATKEPITRRSMTEAMVEFKLWNAAGRQSHMKKTRSETLRPR